MELTVFRELFGDNPTIRVIDFFLDNQEFEYSMADVIREEGMTYNTLRPVWAALITRNMIMQTGKAGKGILYRINKKNPIVKQLNALCWTLVETHPETAQYFKQRKIKAA